jgi:hypothetical protein
VLVELAASDEQLQGGPASPQHESAGVVVAFAVLVAAESREGEVEVVHAPVDSNFAMSPLAEDGDIFSCDVLGCGSCLGVGAAAGVTQIEQGERDDREQLRRLRPSRR